MRTSAGEAGPIPKCVVITPSIVLLRGGVTK